MFYALWVFRQLVTDDSYSRLFYCLSLILSTGMAVILPVKTALMVVFGIPPGDRLTILCILSHLCVFVPALPFLYRYTRAPLQKILDAVETQKWYLVSPIPVCFCALNFATGIIMDANPEQPAVLLMGLIIPFTVFAYFLSMSGFLFNRSARLILQQRLMAAEQLERTYRFYNAELSRREQSLRTLRHDFRHHIVHLDALARNADLDGIGKHLSSLSGFENDFAFAPLCENPTVNAIASFHLALAGKNGAACTARAFVPEQLDIGGAELSLIMGNAFENSVKATEGMGEHGYVAFAAYPAKSYLVLKFSNNYDRETYRQGQGVGLESIREVAEKHQGRVEIKDDGREFELTVFLLLFGGRL
jgi:signal transduction histidine kinase